MSVYNPNNQNFNQGYAGMPGMIMQQPRGMVQQQMAYQPLPTPAPTPTLLNGKFVDGIEVVKATDVPMGEYGFYPKADLSEVYLKTWNNNGTTSITTYKVAEAEIKPDGESSTAAIMTRLDQLEQKIDQFISTPAADTNTQPTGKERGVKYNVTL